jgi:hypothetical protein
MKTFTEYLNEKSGVSESAGFEDSAAATAAMDKLKAVANDPKLMSWAKMTDKNFGVHSASALEAVKKAVAKFWSEIEKADE